MARTGILFLVSGPSGSGKSTLCRRLAEEGEAQFSVSCTTRKPRPGEEHGREDGVTDDAPGVDCEPGGIDGRGTLRERRPGHHDGARQQ